MVADWLKPIYEIIRTGVMGGGYVQVDETPIRYLEPGHGQAKLGYLWTAFRPGRPGQQSGAVFYHWETGRSAACLERIIPVDFEGTLQCDARSKSQSGRTRRAVPPLLRRRRLRRSRPHRAHAPAAIHPPPRQRSEIATATRAYSPANADPSPRQPPDCISPTTSLNRATTPARASPMSPFTWVSEHSSPSIAKTSKHQLHYERYSITEESWREIESAQRVVAVGTTSVRTIESAARPAQRFDEPLHLSRLRIQTRRSHAHQLPSSAHQPPATRLRTRGNRPTLAAYRHAVEQRYRFFSYGDCMLIL